jgi:hypothetical protein
MVLWNLLDDVLSHREPFHGLSESMRGGTLGTNPHQRPTNLPNTPFQEPSTRAQNCRVLF